MKRKRSFALLFSLLLLAFCLSPALLSAQETGAEVLLKIREERNYFQKGEVFTLDVYVNASGLYGASIDILFDPSIVKVYEDPTFPQPIIPGDLFPINTDVDQLINQYDNTNGTLSVAKFLLGDSTPITTTEPKLFTGIKFIAVQDAVVEQSVMDFNIAPAGTTALTPGGPNVLVKLSDSAASPILFTGYNTGVVITNAASPIQQIEVHNNMNTPIAVGESVSIQGLIDTGKIHLAAFDQNGNPVDVTGKTLTWRSGNTGVLTVADDLITGVGEGWAPLEVEVDNVIGSTSLSVLNITGPTVFSVSPERYTAGQPIDFTINAKGFEQVTSTQVTVEAYKFSYDDFQSFALAEYQKQVVNGSLSVSDYIEKLKSPEFKASVHPGSGGGVGPEMELVGTAQVLSVTADGIAGQLNALLEGDYIFKVYVDGSEVNHVWNPCFYVRPAGIYLEKYNSNIWPMVLPENYELSDSNNQGNATFYNVGQGTQFGVIVQQSDGTRLNGVIDNVQIFNDGMAEIHFHLNTGLLPGIYQILIQANDGSVHEFPLRPLHVGYPVIDFIEPMYIPAGVEEFDLDIFANMAGYTPQNVSVDLVDDLGSVKAVGINSDTYSPHFKFNVLGGLSSGSVYAVLRADDRFSNRKPIKVVQPMLTGKVSPPVFKTGVSSIGVKIEGYNLLAADSYTVKLVNFPSEPNRQELAVANNVPVVFSSINSQYPYLDVQLSVAGGVPAGNYILEVTEASGRPVFLPYHWMYGGIDVEFTNDYYFYGLSQNQFHESTDGKNVKVFGANIAGEQFNVEIRDDNQNIVTDLGIFAAVNDTTTAEEFLIVTLPPLDPGKYALSIWHASSWVRYNNMDFYVSAPSSLVRLVPPAFPPEELMNPDGYYASFDVTIETENIDWSSLNHAADVEVRLENRFGVIPANSVSLPDADGKMTASFQRVPVGDYKLEARVGEHYAGAPLYVNSYLGKPVILDIKPWAVPYGYKYYGINLEGYNLQPLASGTTVEIRDDAGNPVATTVGDANENMLGVFVGPEGRSMHVEMKAVGDNIPSGAYDVVIINTNWDPEAGHRVEKLVVTDGPALVGHVHPWVLGAGVTGFTLEMPGFNLKQLNPLSLDVQLKSPDGTTSLSSDNVTVITGENNHGFIKADFSTALPPDTRNFRVTVNYLGSALPGSEDLWVEVADHTVVYGVDPHNDIPGKSTYNLVLKGWNFDTSKTYTVRVMGPGGEVPVQNLVTQTVSPTDVNVSFDIAGGLNEGSYSLELLDGMVFLGQVFFNVMPGTVQEPVATSIDINGPGVITIPSSGVIASQYVAYVKDQNGQAMAGETVSWRLAAPVIGVQVDASTGQVTVDTTAVPDTTFTLEAVSNTNQNLYLGVIVTLAAPQEDGIIPHLEFNQPAYAPGSMARLDLKLTGIQSGDKTNSVTFEFEYDNDTFELATGNVENDVVNGYIAFTSKDDIPVSGTLRKIKAMFTAFNDTVLEEGSVVLSVNFRVKDTASLGPKMISLKPVDMLDSTFKSYNVNNGQEAYVSTSIAEFAVIEGYIGLYLGDPGTGLNNLLLGKLNWNAINTTFNNLNLMAKCGTEEAGIFFGQTAFIPDELNNLAATVDNKLVGMFRIQITDFAVNKLKIGSAGYLGKDIDIEPVAGQTYTIGTYSSPIMLYPGDLGQVIAGQGLVLEPNGKVDNVDFSAWLKIYKDNLSGNAGQLDINRADMTKDSKIDNIDFSLWLASYKKLLSNPI